MLAVSSSAVRSATAFSTFLAAVVSWPRAASSSSRVLRSSPSAVGPRSTLLVARQGQFVPRGLQFFVGLARFTELPAGDFAALGRGLQLASYRLELRLRLFHGGRERHLLLDGGLEFGAQGVAGLLRLFGGLFQGRLQLDAKRFEGLPSLLGRVRCRFASPSTARACARRPPPSSPRAPPLRPLPWSGGRRNRRLPWRRSRGTPSVACWRRGVCHCKSHTPPANVVHQGLRGVRAAHPPTNPHAG